MHGNYLAFHYGDPGTLEPLNMWLSRSAQGTLCNNEEYNMNSPDSCQYTQTTGHHGLYWCLISRSGRVVRIVIITIIFVFKDFCLNQDINKCYHI